MTITTVLLKELKDESATTRKMLGRVPADKYDWRPHPKSMTIRQLASHIADIPGWVSLAINTDELDFAKADAPAVINTNEELMASFEHNVSEAISDLGKADPAIMDAIWTMRNGDQVYMAQTKAETIRHSLSQTIHHRAQLGVFLRLLDIPIPGSYGPSADEMPSMM
jgi:uncharacterized damage-inducible protein DinB